MHANTLADRHRVSGMDLAWATHDRGKAAPRRPGEAIAGRAGDHAAEARFPG